MLIAMLEDEPDDLFLNYAVGVELISAANFLEAESRFKKVIGLDADYIPAYYQMGKMLETQTKKTEALAFYKTGMEIARRQKHKSVHEFEEAIFLLED